MHPHKRYLKNFLINKPFQGRICYYMVALTLAISGVMAALISFTLNQMRWLLSGAPNLPVAVLISFEAKFAQILVICLAFVLLSIVGTVLYGIIISHRIAGPMHAILSYIEAIKRGQAHTKRPLRPYDELQPIMDSLHDLAKQMRPNGP